MTCAAPPVASIRLVVVSFFLSRSKIYPPQCEWAISWSQRIWHRTVLPHTLFGSCLNCFCRFFFGFKFEGPLYYSTTTRQLVHFYFIHVCLLRAYFFFGLSLAHLIVCHQNDCFWSSIRVLQRPRMTILLCALYNLYICLPIQKHIHAHTNDHKCKHESSWTERCFLPIIIIIVHLAKSFLRILLSCRVFGAVQCLHFVSNYYPICR